MFNIDRPGYCTTRFHIDTHDGRTRAQNINRGLYIETYGLEVCIKSISIGLLISFTSNLESAVSLYHILLWSYGRICTLTVLAAVCAIGIPHQTHTHLYLFSWNNMYEIQMIIGIRCEVRIGQK